MTAPESTDAHQARANELYWKSQDTVDQVAEQLGMARSALYAAVRPLSVGAECPDCGGELVFPNRSARASGTATCLACDHTVAVDELSAAPTGNGRSAAPPLEHLPTDRLRRWREDLAAVEPQRAALIGGAAALGVFLGAAAASAFRRGS